MRARNEELQSVNEEYRSATEELETSKEELQSTNEELQAVNDELKLKVDEVSRAHSDLQNLLDATEIATLFLDRELRILRYTQSSADLFNIRATDVGRPLGELKSALVYNDLLDDARRAFERLELVEREVRDGDDTWFLVRHRPYRNEADQISGVLLTFVDITEQKHAEQSAGEAQTFAEHIVDTVREGLLVLDTDFRVLQANESFYRMFSVTPEETEGRRLFELGDGEWAGPGLRALLQRVLPERKAFNDFEVTHDFEGIGRRTVLLNGRQLDHQQRILLAIEDVSDRSLSGDRMEAAVQDRTSQVRALASALVLAEQRERHRISSVLHDHLQQILYGLQVHTTQLAGQVPEAFRGKVVRCTELLDDAVGITRTLTVELSPPVLKGEGLDAALSWLGTQVEAMYDLRVEVSSVGPIRVASEDTRVLLFQLVRELLFNVAKHAQTDRARVELEDGPDALRIHVVDEGAGFDPDEVFGHAPETGHVGLARMQERLGLFGGRLEVVTAPGQGTVATIIVRRTGRAD